MLRNKKDKTEKKHRLPTEEEMLSYRPKRLDFKWSTDEQGLVTIKVPKFESKIGISLCKLIKKDNHFNASLDKIGSLVWKNCDGKHTVKEILEILKKEYPDDKNINQRLYLFIQQLGRLQYITY